MVVEGKISNIVDFGAFVDLDGIDGLIHISELSWSHVNHPSEVLSVGETVRVKVLDIDRERQRISLGLKQTQEDPWRKVLDEYRQGEVLEGKVTKVVAFGAFVEIIPGSRGWSTSPSSPSITSRVPSEVVSPGDQVWVRILEIDESRRRISLSVKRAESQNLPLRDLIPPELAEQAQPEAATDEVPGPRRLRGGLPRGSAPRRRRTQPEASEPADEPRPRASRRGRGRRAHRGRAGERAPRRRGRVTGSQRQLMPDFRWCMHRLPHRPNSPTRPFIRA